MSAEFNQITFNDLFFQVWKIKIKIIISFVIIVLISSFFSLFYIKPNFSHKAIFYSDLIHLKFFILNEKNLYIKNFDVSHEELINKLYLEIYRNTTFAKDCSEFKVVNSNLISTIECIKSLNISNSIFEKNINEYLTIILDNQIKYMTQYLINSNINSDTLFNQSSIENLNQSINFEHLKDVTNIIFFNIFIILFYLFLLIFYLILKTKKKIEFK